EGRGGDGKTKVYGPAKFDSRSRFSGRDVAEAGGALGPVLLIVLPLAILMAIGWLLYRLSKWFFKQPAKTRLVILEVVLAITGIAVGLHFLHSSAGAAKQVENGTYEAGSQANHTPEAAATLSASSTESTETTP